MKQNVEMDCLPIQLLSSLLVWLQPKLCLSRKMDRESRFFDLAQIFGCNPVPNVEERITRTDTTHEKHGLEDPAYWHGHWKVQVSSLPEFPLNLQSPILIE